MELERIRSNTGWVLCQPKLNYSELVIEKECERQDALMEEVWRIKNRQRTEREARDMFAQLEEAVVDAIKQFKRKEEAKQIWKKEEDENIAKIFDTDLNSRAGTMPGATPLIHPKGGDPPAGPQPGLNKCPTLNNPRGR